MKINYFKFLSLVLFLMLPALVKSQANAADTAIMVDAKKKPSGTYAPYSTRIIRNCLKKKAKVYLT